MIAEMEKREQAPEVKRKQMESLGEDIGLGYLKEEEFGAENSGEGDLLTKRHGKRSCWCLVGRRGG